MPPRMPPLRSVTAVFCCPASRAQFAVATASSPAIVPETTTATTQSLTSPSWIASLFGALSIQTRKASILANLSDNAGAYSKKIRKGRGPSSGYGKTSGRGQKGRKARGQVRSHFQGGQTSLVGVWGKKGFVNHRAPVMSEVNLDQVQAWIDAGRLDPTKQITPKELVQSGLVGRPRDGVKLLARGGTQLRTAIDIVASRASGAAIEAIEAAGGKVVTRYYTKLAIQRLVRGESVHTSEPLPVGSQHLHNVISTRRKQARYMYRLPDPTSRWDIEYYRDPAHRGYLSHQLSPGESPSLYFKVPTERKVHRKSAKDTAKRTALNEDMLW